MLIALSGFSISGSETDSVRSESGVPDSVTISVAAANRVYKKLELCSLDSAELVKYRMLDVLKDVEIVELENKIEIQGTHIKKQGRFWKKKEVWGFVGVVLGVFIAR